MKKRTYFIYIGVIVIAYITIFIVGYYYGKNIDPGEIIIKSEVESANPVLSGDDVIVVDETEGSVITSTTKIFIEKYNIATASSSTEESVLRTDYIGLSREELINYITENIDSYSEDGKDVRSVDVVTFSPTQVILKKSFINSTANFSYVIKELDGYLVVYQAETHAVYLNTLIKPESLSQEEQEELKTGIQLESLHEMYSFLESHTS